MLEGAADVLRGVSGADHHGDGQAEVLQHGPRSDHVDGIDHLSDRDRREAKVPKLPEQEESTCQGLNQDGWSVFGFHRTTQRYNNERETSSSYKNLFK